MRVLIAVPDLLARSRIEAAARAAGHEVAPGSRVPAPSEPAPDLLVADLDAPAALERLEEWRAAHPDGPVTGFAFHVNEQVIERARALGVRV
ncbi:MAG: hypothetical protein ACRDJM_00070, partial [Actinomycetota bacterium]